MSTFPSNIIYNFLIAFGVIVGASLFAGLGALINDHPPLKSMFQIASSIKIWAVAVALGGTFSTFEILEKGIFKGEIRSIIKQAVYVVVAVIGANVGYGFIRLVQRCGETMFK
ncbi:MAG TPA: YtrH family sporulation protein [Acetivibrio sp.]|uniref:YtrH family sporulation protein n=1 Tax=Acetivibrio sp. TaxID=1872092 RepID=UPI002C602FBE|nr:YtrH family sporulation protein [Acetivibrio sp.]HOM01790.1 YtrH family sporulation protein [Acetivibrio sp.]